MCLDCESAQVKVLQIVSQNKHGANYQRPIHRGENHLARLSVFGLNLVWKILEHFMHFFRLHRNLHICAYH
jgi:hypothetical protein